MARGVPGWPEDGLYESVRGENRAVISGVLGGLLLAGGGGLALVGALGWSRQMAAYDPALPSIPAPPMPEQVWVGAVGALVGLLLVVRWLRSPRFVRVLRDQRERIVWLYPLGLVREGAMGGQPESSMVMLGLDDGTTVQVHVNGTQVEALLGRLSALVPQATVGFSPALQERFARDPASLRVAS